MKIPNTFYRVSVKALITNENNEILLIQEDNGKWDLPGGGLDFGDDFHSAIKREIKEELGVNVKSISKDPTYIWTEKKPDFYLLFLGYKTELSSFEFHRSPECVDSKFCKKSELSKINLHINIKKLPEMFNVEDF